MDSWASLIETLAPLIVVLLMRTLELLAVKNATFSEDST
jgi:hypothetical protein